MVNLNKLYLAYKISKNPEQAGDFALLKSSAFGARANRLTEAKMQSVRGYYPEIDLEKLSQLPLGTFGYEYARYMQKNKLQPIKISPEFAEIARSNVFATRYAVTHDIFHLLLGFDTSYAGEIGVLAFAVEQNYSRMLNFSLFPAMVIYSAIAPTQFRSILANIRRGKQMARKASFLLNYRFEDYWTKPIDTVRLDLGIEC